MRPSARQIHRRLRPGGRTHSLCQIKRSKNRMRNSSLRDFLLAIKSKGGEAGTESAIIRFGRSVHTARGYWRSFGAGTARFVLTRDRGPKRAMAIAACHLAQAVYALGARPHGRSEHLTFRTSNPSGIARSPKAAGKYAKDCSPNVIFLTLGRDWAGLGFFRGSTHR
jgi:hypothetical protein